MKPGDLVLFNGDCGRFDVPVGSTGLILETRENPFGSLPGDIEVDVLADGVIIRQLLVDGWVEVLNEAG
jgi:hypothetical protein